MTGQMPVASLVDHHSAAGPAPGPVRSNEQDRGHHLADGPESTCRNPHEPLSPSCGIRNGVPDRAGVDRPEEHRVAPDAVENTPGRVHLVTYAERSLSGGTGPPLAQAPSEVIR